VASPLSDLRAAVLVPVYALHLSVGGTHYTSLAGQRKRELPYAPTCFASSGR